jgi:twitching motility protein PilT
MQEILKAAVQRGASDLHIKAGDVFRARVHGELIPLSKQRLTPEQTRQIALQLIPHQRDRERIDELRDYDCSWGVSGIGRFRVNLLRQRGSIMIVMRVIPFEIPSFESLKLPPVLERIANANRGLVLVTGITGSGKSTTLASIIGYINQHHRKHIITLEDPIEFLHRDRNSSITQREVGTDTASFASGLSAALREDPDVILVGEMRDIETISLGITAAETGHLVFATLHTNSAPKTIDRIIDVFPVEQQEQIRAMLGETLRGVVAQQLLRRLDGGGRVAALEILIATPAVANLIREGKTHQIPSIMQTGRKQGMVTMDQSLMDLLMKKVVSPEEAYAKAHNKAEFMPYLEAESTRWRARDREPPPGSTSRQPSR